MKKQLILGIAILTIGIGGYLYYLGGDKENNLKTNEVKTYSDCYVFNYKYKNENGKKAKCILFKENESLVKNTIEEYANEDENYRKENNLTKQDRILILNKKFAKNDKQVIKEAWAASVGGFIFPFKHKYKGKFYSYWKSDEDNKAIRKALQYEDEKDKVE